MVLVGLIFFLGEVKVFLEFFNWLVYVFDWYGSCYMVIWVVRNVGKVSGSL